MGDGAGQDGLPTRRAARVVVVSPLGRVLLMRYRSGAAGDAAVTGVGAFWVTPGGGLEEGETFEAAAVRELREETGIEVDGVGPVVAERFGDLWISGVLMRCHEVFYVVRAASEDLGRGGWTAQERRDVTDVRWFRADELRGAGDWADMLAPPGGGAFFAACAEGRVPEGVTRLG